ncbi:glycoside hydrolase superfamily [Xylariaceae sp. FL1651]|nr:glycoside hydrolase superfamily [Xylariaceae sp. FL1651]
MSGKKELCLGSQQETSARDLPAEPSMVGVIRIPKGRDDHVAWLGAALDAVYATRQAGREIQEDAIEVDSEDCNQEVSDQYEINAWVSYDIPGWENKYSKIKYRWYHFSGVDFNARNEKTAIYKIMGDKSIGWAENSDIDHEKGNYDFLIGSDLDYSRPESKLVGRVVSPDSTSEGDQVSCRQALRRGLPAQVHHNVERELWGEVDRIKHKFSPIDASLIYKFSEIGKASGADLRKVFDDTLVASSPINAVTVVMNHDTQPYQVLEAPIENRFKLLAYSLILWRNSGYPCLFYGDLYGISGENPFPPMNGGDVVFKLALARKLYAYGKWEDYFDFATCIGWCAVLLSNAGSGEKRVHVEGMHAGEVWTDVLG